MPRAEVPVYPEDDVVPSQIPPKIRSPEYGGGLSDASLNTQAARAIEAMSVTTAPEPDEAVASRSAMGDMRRVELPCQA